MNNTAQENLMLRYLLGDLPEEKQFALEQEYFADSEKFEQIWALENELVDDYVRGRLPNAERTLFERNYLASPKHQARVAVARTLVQAADETIVVENKPVPIKPTASWWSNLLASLQLTQLAWSGAAALAILLLALGGWWYLRNASSPAGQIARQEPPISPVRVPSLDAPSPQPIASETLKPVLPTPTPQSSPRARPAVPAVLAFALGGALRNSGEIHRLSVPLGTKQVRMRINLEDAEHPRYQIRLRTVGGEEVLTPQSLRPVGQAVFLMIPANKLPHGDYSLTLSGVNNAGEAEELTKYFLRVTQK